MLNGQSLGQRCRNVMLPTVAQQRMVTIAHQQLQVNRECDFQHFISFVRLSPIEGDEDSIRLFRSQTQHLSTLLADATMENKN